MRDSNEKKSITKSLKLSKNQWNVIEQAAKEKGMNFSQYAIETLMHGGNCITPQIAVKMQELVNIVEDISDNINEKDYKRREALRQKTHAFKELVKFDSPDEKYEKLEKNMKDFIEGGNEVWAHLNT